MAREDVGPREDDFEPIPQGESGGVFADAEDELIGTESSEDDEAEPRPDANTVGEISEPQTVATVRAGEAATLRGAVPEIEASVLYVQDPAQADDDVEPEEGMRYVGVLLQIRNTGTETHDDMPSMYARLYLAGGEECEAEVGRSRTTRSWTHSASSSRRSPRGNRRRQPSGSWADRRTCSSLPASYDREQRWRLSNACCLATI